MFPNCPICGFTDMPYAPVPFNVCPCCGTEFGVDDRKVTHPELTQAWITLGKPWFDDITSPPKKWNPEIQLKQAGLLPLADSQIIITIMGQKSEITSTEITILQPLWNLGELKRFAISTAQIPA